MFAQMYQIPLYQVISALEYFSDIGLKQHLEYALHNVINSASSDELTTARSGKDASKTKASQQQTAAKKNKKSYGREKKRADSSDEDEKTEYESSSCTEKYQSKIDVDIRWFLFWTVYRPPT